jgi:hypothetical protein
MGNDACIMLKATMQAISMSANCGLYGKPAVDALRLFNQLIK